MSYVQSAANATSGAATSLATAFGSNTGTGHCLLCFIRLSSGSDLITGVSDNVNGAWTRIGRTVHTSGSVSSFVYKLASGTAGTVTVTVASSSASYRMAIAEYTEADVDQIVSNTLATSTTPVSGTVVAAAGATVVGYLGLDSGTTTFSGAGSPTSSSRQDITVASAAANIADLTATTAGGYTVSWSLGATKVTTYFAISMQGPATGGGAVLTYNRMLQGY